MRLRFALLFGARALRGRGGAGRYLRGSVLGIALSLVPLIVVMEVSTGMIEGITARLLEVGTYHIQVLMPSDTDRAALQASAEAIGGLAGVLSASPERQATALLFSESGSSGITLRCVPADVFSRDAGLRSLVTITEGSLDLSDPGNLLVSAALAQTLGAAAGDEVSLLTSYGETVMGPQRVTRMRIAGIYETGYQEMDKVLAYASIDGADRMLSPRASRALVGVKVTDPFGDLAPALSEIRASVSTRSIVSTWRELEYSRLKSFETTKSMLLAIMAMVVLVSSVNVSSSVLMIVLERRADIGILSSMGAEPSSLSMSFVLAGLATGLAGALVGIACGLAIAVNINGVISGLEAAVNVLIRLAADVRSSLVHEGGATGAVTVFNSAYYLKSIPVRVRAVEVVIAAVGTVLLSGLAALIPAQRAARIPPLEIIRKT